jgi:ethanolamine ammonia-lyase small subunit
MSDDTNLQATGPWLDTIRKVRARTPARIFVERGPAYSTEMQLDLRNAHAAAVDAVWSEFDPSRDLPAGFLERWQMFMVSSQAESKSQFLLRPDLGRRLSDSGRELIRNCPTSPDLQVILGDGLSAPALSTQAPVLFPLVEERARARGWSIGRPFVVRYCRVGIMNDVGDLVAPRVLVLLIGERPGLATAESLSAYMAYFPRAGHTDADRNLISNIHARGIHVEDAADRIVDLASRMLALKLSGTALKAGKLGLV